MSSTQTPAGKPTRKKASKAHTKTPTVGFTIREADRPALDAVVERFGDGNRSEFLRQAVQVMTTIMIAEDLRELQRYGTERAEAAGFTDIQQVIDWQKRNRG